MLTTRPNSAVNFSTPSPWCSTFELKPRNLEARHAVSDYVLQNNW